jgi:adenylate kinase family enzyme
VDSETRLTGAPGQDWILDGFPRTASQAALLDAALAEANERLTLVINLAVPDEVIIDRIKGQNAFAIFWIGRARLNRVFDLTRALGARSFGSVDSSGYRPPQLKAVRS